MISVDVQPCLSKKTSTSPLKTEDTKSIIYKTVDLPEPLSPVRTVTGESCEKSNDVELIDRKFFIDIFTSLFMAGPLYSLASARRLLPLRGLLGLPPADAERGEAVACAKGGSGSSAPARKPYRAISRWASRSSARRFRSSRLSKSFLPRPTAISSFTLPCWKYMRTGTTVRPFWATRPA